VLTAGDEGDVQRLVSGLASDGDMVICLGAGDITQNGG
jgi:UDP-N-acetylmuramate-alanine ligase